MWCYAVLVLAAGYIKNTEVAISAFSICLNINGWEFMITLGLLGASCVRVTNELGRGVAKAVKFAIKVLLSTSTLIGVSIWILCLVFGNKSVTYSRMMRQLQRALQIFLYFLLSLCYSIASILSSQVLQLDQACNLQWRLSTLYASI